MSRLDMWSRRKAAVQAEAEAEVLAVKAAEAEEQAQALADKSDEEILEELGLPDPDSLEEGDDFQAFLKDAVPARLKTRALRRLWRVNPVLANIDGLVDYGEDFTDASTVIDNLQTAYQVGKGMTMHVEELARQAKDNTNTIDQIDQDQEAQDDMPEDMTPNAVPAEIVGSEVEEETVVQSGQTDGEKTGNDPKERLQGSDVAENDAQMRYTVPRRMRFRFVEPQETA